MLNSFTHALPLIGLHVTSLSNNETTKRRGKRKFRNISSTLHDNILCVSGPGFYFVFLSFYFYQNAEFIHNLFLNRHLIVFFFFSFFFCLSFIFLFFSGGEVWGGWARLCVYVQSFGTSRSSLVLCTIFCRTLLLIVIPFFSPSFASEVACLRAVNATVRF